jgi:hypothetical protein
MHKPYVRIYVGIRLLPSVKCMIQQGVAPSPFIAFAVAALLRFITPLGTQDITSTTTKFRSIMDETTEKHGELYSSVVLFIIHSFNFFFF